jgi:hypothetical protein
MHPSLRASLVSSWQSPTGIGAGVRLYYIGSLMDCGIQDCNAPTTASGVGAWYKLDLYGTFAFTTSLGESVLYAGINNATNALPPQIYNTAEVHADAAAYDPIGRFAYLRLSHRF